MKKIRLHIGCGERILEGWNNVDKCHSYYTMKGDTLIAYGDATDLKDYEDGSVDEIYASHVLDHLSRKDELDKGLDEWHRVLKPGGCLRVAVSDFDKVFIMYREGVDLERLWGHLVGGQKSPFDRHGCVFNFTVLRRYLEKHGFINVRRYNWQDFLPKDFDDLSRCYIPHMSFDDGILMSLNVISEKPLNTC